MTFWGFCRRLFLAGIVFSFLVLLASCRRKAEPGKERVTSEAAGASGAVTENGEASASLEEIPDYDEAAGGEGTLLPLPSIDEIIGIEEEEMRIAGELERMEREGMDSASADEAAEKLPDDFTARSGLLEFSRYENEIVQISESGGGRVLTYSIGSRTERKFYDESYRLSRTELWSIKGLGDSRLVREESFSYGGGNELVEKTVDYELTRERLYYGKNGLVEKSETFKKVGENFYITERSRRKYDSQGRLCELSRRSFSYNDFEDTKRRDAFVKTFKYRYNEKSEEGTEIPPDLDYYENGVMKASENYSERPGTFTKRYFFDGNISVKAWYADFKKIREAIYLGDKLLRISKFDEKEPAL